MASQLPFKAEYHLPERQPPGFQAAPEGMSEPLKSGEEGEEEELPSEDDSEGDIALSAEDATSAEPMNQRIPRELEMVHAKLIIHKSDNQLPKYVMGNDRSELIPHNSATYTYGGPVVRVEELQSNIMAVMLCTPAYCTVCSSEDPAEALEALRVDGDWDPAPTFALPTPSIYLGRPFVHAKDVQEDAETGRLTFEPRGGNMDGLEWQGGPVKFDHVGFRVGKWYVIPEVAICELESCAVCKNRRGRDRMSEKALRREAVRREKKEAERQAKMAAKAAEEKAKKDGEGEAQEAANGDGGAYTNETTTTSEMEIDPAIDTIFPQRNKSTRLASKKVAKKIANDHGGASTNETTTTSEMEIDPAVDVSSSSVGPADETMGDEQGDEQGDLYRWYLEPATQLNPYPIVAEYERRKMESSGKKRAPK